MRGRIKKIAIMLFVGCSFNVLAEEIEQLNFTSSMCARNFTSQDQGNTEIMLDYCQASAEDGDMISAAFLGQIYMHGVKGAPRSPEKAYEWTKVAADQGHVPSIAEIGRMKLLGFGTEEDFDGAKKVLDQAIDKRSGSAAYYKSVWYLYGVEKRPNELMSFEERMTKVCEMNFIAIDYGYTSKRKDFNVLLDDIVKTLPDSGVKLVTDCTKNVLEYHKEHNDEFLYYNAGQPVQNNRRMPNGPYPITSPEFWLNILSPKKP